jgi:hypothetical protein
MTIIVVMFGCRKSSNGIETEKYPLLLNKPWRLYQVDSAILDPNNNIISIQTNPVTDCRKIEEITFETKGKVSKRSVCRFSSPVIQSGSWEIQSEKNLFYIFNPGSDFPFTYAAQIQKLTTDTLSLIYLINYSGSNGQNINIPTTYRYIH